MDETIIIYEQLIHGKFPSKTAVSVNETVNLHDDQGCPESSIIKIADRRTIRGNICLSQRKETDNYRVKLDELFAHVDQLI